MGQINLSFAQVSERLSYDPLTGDFVWLKGASRKFPAGAPAGHTHGTLRRPYRTITILGHTCYASRLAWLLMTGRWPIHQIDHINRDSLDDRWVNLREASNSQNNANKLKQRNSTSGFKGVFRDRRKSTKPWYAQIKHRSLGAFATAEEAAAAYDAAAAKMYGEFAGLNFPR